MKQGTLSFASAKRTNSTANGKPLPKTRVAEKRRSKRAETPAETRHDAKTSEIHEISSDDEGAIGAARNTVPTKRARASAKGRSSSEHAPVQSSKSDTQTSSPAEVERQHLDVEDKSGFYLRYYNEVRSKMGYIPPIHSEGQNEIHQILRFFDMSYEFGPCIGMTRLERWERAEAFGLNPPVEVRDILHTKEGIEKPEYARCALDTEV